MIPSLLAYLLYLLTDLLTGSSQGMATLQKHTPVRETGLDQKLTLHVYR